MAKSRNKPAENLPSFESNFDELQSIVNKLEDDEASLDTALELFEKGVTHVREAQRLLEASEQRVRILLESDHSPASEPLPSEEGNT